ncbi:bis(5'-nucleosyl)-tetraphosphatase (symmetrical) YqeK [Oceanobacillus bengalensis]|uniref:bis(5'-nucleosyl)-tetraphosphatase (symmetrical) n=1 Tax=Oceanobacillus bengalensis TaxID=1435466 RepID=A0A494Z6E2_9BACI|nr:bis(5'-nucleosyl)-tetraphosphatase (symmetrical) YqeK [Oceanobacillus bengalensis]RKQ17875.1 HD domain-containing protein [Oceanobacillus bengalensis]
MKKENAIEIVKPHLKKKRFEHTLRVADTAEQLAGIYNESKEKATLAAIFHDYCKYRPLEEMKRCIVSTRTLPKDLLDFHHELWHGPVGSVLVEKEYGIVDRDIRSAIYYHTTGRANMSKLEMIIFLADYIEPGRDFPGVHAVRELAREDLLGACLLASKNTINHLLSKGASIYPDTFHAYNDLTKRVNGGN